MPRIIDEVERFELSHMFASQDKAQLRSEFQKKFVNITQMMDCVGCETCKVGTGMRLTTFLNLFTLKINTWEYWIEYLRFLYMLRFRSMPNSNFLVLEPPSRFSSLVCLSVHIRDTGEKSPFIDMFIIIVDDFDFHVCPLFCGSLDRPSPLRRNWHSHGCRHFAAKWSDRPRQLSCQVHFRPPHLWWDAWYCWARGFFFVELTNLVLQAMGYLRIHCLQHVVCVYCGFLLGPQEIVWFRFRFLFHFFMHMIWCLFWLNVSFYLVFIPLLPSKKLWTRNSVLYNLSKLHTDKGNSYIIQGLPFETPPWTPAMWIWIGNRLGK